MNKYELEPRGACPLCGNDEKRVHMAFREIPVAQCTKCEFLFSDRIMSRSSLDEYYTTNFGGLRHQQGQTVNAIVNVEILRRLIDLNSVSNALDVGTGYGFLLQRLQTAHSVNAVGVELSTQEAEYGNQRLGVKIFPQFLEEAPIEKGFFDLVIACEVVEHTADPVTFIGSLAQYLNPTGKLVLMTDNFQSKVVKSLGPAWPKWIPHTHVSHFAPQTITKAVKQAGLEVCATASFTPWEHSLRALVTNLKGEKIPAEKAFDLSAALETEMTRPYAFFALRKFLNPLWTRLFMRRDLEGAMMCVVAVRKESSPA